MSQDFRTRPGCVWFPHLPDWRAGVYSSQIQFDLHNRVDSFDCPGNPGPASGATRNVAVDYGGPDQPVIGADNGSFSRLKQDEADMKPASGSVVQIGARRVRKIGIWQSAG